MGLQVGVRIRNAPAAAHGGEIGTRKAAGGTAARALDGSEGTDMDVKYRGRNNYLHYFGGSLL